MTPQELRELLHQAIDRIPDWHMKVLAEGWGCDRPHCFWRERVDQARLLEMKFVPARQDSR